MDSAKSEFKVYNLEPNSNWQLIEDLKKGWKIVTSCGYMEERADNGYVGGQNITVKTGYPMIQYVLERDELARLTYG